MTTLCPGGFSLPPPGGRHKNILSTDGQKCICGVTKWGTKEIQAEGSQPRVGALLLLSVLAEVTESRLKLLQPSR